ncbi:MAG TPA: OB-fold domain-containing protein [Thermoplasmata archaeon]|nr:OB-fold domain-containing protein [Thermoplasmata archaeon]
MAEARESRRRAEADAPSPSEPSRSETRTSVPPREGPKPKPTPTAFDFFPQEEAQQTRVARFFDELRGGRFTTTRCRKDGELLWPPRVTCPHCHGEEMDWVTLPLTGTLYAFSALLAGAPLGMETELPIVMGLADLDGEPLRLFGRIVGASWDQLRVGQAVRIEPFELADGRVFYRFRALGAADDRVVS